jgi:hypothetical protein
MSLSFDPADDPGDELRANLRNATGAWLYMVDNLLRTDARGGLAPEGFEYGPQTLGCVAQFLLALKTAGQDDAAVHGPQVELAQSPFWDDVIRAYAHSLSPAPITNDEPGHTYQPAWYGDGQHYQAPDYILALGPLALVDQITGNNARVQAIRWIQTNLAPGGAERLGYRARDGNFYIDAILYFLLFDPQGTAPEDPRSAMPITHFASGIGRLLARTDWTPNAAWFTYKLSWNRIDHQQGDGNQFEFYRRGEWLTKERTGYDLDYGSSRHHNTLALENNPPAPDYNTPGDPRNVLWRTGSQWAYSSTGDPRILGLSATANFVYVLGDATNLYNSEYLETPTDIEHASRSIVWQKPDHVLIYDRASSKSANRFKRFNLNLPTQAMVTGNLTSVMTNSGQQLFVNTLLPEGAAPAVEKPAPLYGDAATDEPMAYSLRVEAPGNPQKVRFLHVLQGADPGATPDRVQLVRTTVGTPFEGAVLKNIVTLFPVDLAARFTSIQYGVPANTRTHRITGLTAKAGYRVTVETIGPEFRVMVTAGGSDKFADEGGVLEFSAQ